MIVPAAMGSAPAVLIHCEKVSSIVEVSLERLLISRLFVKFPGSQPMEMEVPFEGLNLPPAFRCMKSFLGCRSLDVASGPLFPESGLPVSNAPRDQAAS